jgi:hypothetical protein
MKLKFNSKRNYRKYSNTWSLLNDPWVIEEIRGENTRFLESKGMEPEPLGYRKGSVKRQVFSHEYLHQQTRETSHN